MNAYRSSNGAPGPQYWQNEADYDLHATLDTEHKQLRATETITYTNNSPDALPSLWVQLDQNIYREDSRAHIISAGSPRPRGGEMQPAADTNAAPQKTSTEGFVFDSVAIEQGKQTAKADYLINDTRMQIRLPQPLKAHGQLKIHIQYHYDIPGEWGGRTSWGMSKQGEIYDMAQWYPRMCVYDDLRGMGHAAVPGKRVLSGVWEFRLLGDGAGEHDRGGIGRAGESEGGADEDGDRSAGRGANSDKTVYIRKPDEVTSPASRPKQDGTLTWRFHMDHTRDVVWSASPVFVWDAARINLPDGKKALAMSVYPPESVGADAWDKSTEYVKDTVEHFSKQWFPYPWPVAISVAGFSTGMEYPGVVFDGITDKGSFLFWVTAHEIGHSWFPMIVGSNERRHAFMDEGFNTFIDIDESATYAGGKYGPKRDSEYSAGGEPPDTILKVLDNPDAATLMATADSYGWALGHPVSYFKGAYGMVLLREQILGPERFDWAFRKYIRDWAFKHPSPSDFFREIESESGEDLSWFWRGWYLNNWKYDVAAEKIDGGDGDVEQSRTAGAADDGGGDVYGWDEGAGEAAGGDVDVEGHVCMDAGQQEDRLHRWWWIRIINCRMTIARTTR